MRDFQLLYNRAKRAPIRPEWITYEERERLDAITELRRACRHPDSPAFAKNEMARAYDRHREAVHYGIRRRHVLEIPLTREEILNEFDNFRKGR